MTNEIGGSAGYESAWGDITHRLALRSVTAFISHELNHPLGTITNLVTLLERGLQKPVVRPSEMAKHFEGIKHEVRRAADVVKQLRILAGNVGGHSDTINCYDFLKVAVSRFRRRYSVGVVAIRVECKDRNISVIAADDLLHIALYNLMVNAVEAMHGSGVEKPRLILRATAVEQMVALDVIDNGFGVPTELRERLFEPFVSGRDGGSGLGLTIARDIAERNGGSILLLDEAAGSYGRFRILLKIGAVTNEGKK